MNSFHPITDSLTLKSIHQIRLRLLSISPIGIQNQVGHLE